jgi:hypothetical protein
VVALLALRDGRWRLTGEVSVCGVGPNGNRLAPSLTLDFELVKKCRESG